MKKFAIAFVFAALPSLALAKEPPRFANLDAEKLVWIVDVPGRNSCVTAAMMLAVSQHKALDRTFPTIDDDTDYKLGCIATLK